MTTDKPMSSVIHQLSARTSPTALSGTLPAAHEDVMELRVAELVALIELEACADSTAINTLVGLTAAVAFARTVLARDAVDGFAKESGR